MSPRYSIPSGSMLSLVSDQTGDPIAQLGMITDDLRKIERLGSGTDDEEAPAVLTQRAPIAEPGVEAGPADHEQP